MADSRKYTSPVPTDYQEVEYIQSSGNGEYIDIDYTPTINTKFELDFAFVSSSYSQSDSIPVMGERSGTTASDTNKFALWVNKTNGRETLNFGSYDSGFQTATNASLRNVTSNDKAKLYYNGTFISGDDSATFTSGNLSIYLFALNDNGALLSRNNVMKLYGMKLYESGTLVRDLIPCYRKADNVAGLYDTINDVFYTNQGSGSISTGADVNAWLHSLRKLTTATEAVENPLYSDGTAITAYTLKGNEEHTGTPAPSNPVEVNGVGVRTNNLFDYTTMADGVVGMYLNADGTTSNDSRFAITDYIPCDTNTVTLYRGTLNNIPAICCYDENKNYITGISYNAQDPVTLTASQKFKYVRFSWKNSTHSEPDVLTIIRLNNGAYPLPYEPYGYKIPISSGGVTTNIYLGSTQTVRQIKKLVLTGNESGWIMGASNVGKRFGYRVLDAVESNTSKVNSILSHLPLTVSGGTNAYPNTYTIGSDLTLLIVLDSTYTSLNQFLDWLRGQYNNGTPVTLWYRTATPETAAVNEPLMKIGTYADTLSNATAIPTTEGANNITVDTTVQPSEFTATWTGWHDAEVKEKSENLFDYETMRGGKTGYYLDSSGNEIINTGYWSITKYIPVDGTAFTLTRTFGGNAPAICLYDSNKNFITGVSYQGEQVVTISSNTNAAYIRFSYFIGEPLEDVAHDMLNTGSTALPYEPYWK